MTKFNVIHRDFRGCNIFLQNRGNKCHVKVIDLGFMISVEDEQNRNKNIAEVLNGQEIPQKLSTLAVQVEELGLASDLFVRMLDHEDPSNRPTPKELQDALAATKSPQNSPVKPNPKPAPKSITNPQERQNHICKQIKEQMLKQQQELEKRTQQEIEELEFREITEAEMHCELQRLKQRWHLTREEQKEWLREQDEENRRLRLQKKIKQQRVLRQEELRQSAAKRLERGAFMMTLGEPLTPPSPIEIPARPSLLKRPRGSAAPLSSSPSPTAAKAIRPLPAPVPPSTSVIQIEEPPEPPEPAEPAEPEPKRRKVRAPSPENTATTPATKPTKTRIKFAPPKPKAGPSPGRSAKSKAKRVIRTID
eukprot:g1072.t1